MWRSLPWCGWRGPRDYGGMRLKRDECMCVMFGMEHAAESEKHHFLLLLVAMVALATSAIVTVLMSIDSPGTAILMLPVPMALFGAVVAGLDGLGAKGAIVGSMSFAGMAGLMVVAHV